MSVGGPLQYQFLRPFSFDQSSKNGLHQSLSSFDWPPFSFQEVGPNLTDRIALADGLISYTITITPLEAHQLEISFELPEQKETKLRIPESSFNKVSFSRRIPYFFKWQETAQTSPDELAPPLSGLYRSYDTESSSSWTLIARKVDGINVSLVSALNASMSPPTHFIKWQDFTEYLRHLRFLSAYACEDLEAMEVCLNDGLSPDALLEEKMSALVVAARENYLELAKLLIKKGASLQRESVEIAAEEGNPEILRYLLEQKKVIVYPSALVKATTSTRIRSRECLNALLEWGIDTTAGESSLAKKLSEKDLKTILEFSPQVPEDKLIALTDKGAPFKLEQAIDKNYLNFFRQLLQRSPKSATKDHLIKCLDEKRFAMTKVLLANAPNLAQKLSPEELVTYIEKGTSIETLKLLLNAGAPFHKVSKSDKTPLHALVIRGESRPKVWKTFLDKCSPIPSTLVHEAFEQNRPDVLEALLQGGALTQDALKAKSISGHTLLGALNIHSRISKKHRQAIHHSLLYRS